MTCSEMCSHVERWPVKSSRCLLLLALLLAACRGSGDEDIMRPRRIVRPPNFPPSTFEIRLVLDEPTHAAFSFKDSDGQRRYVGPEVIANRADVTYVEVGRGIPPYYATYIHFTPAAAKRLHEFTSVHIGQRLAIIANSEVLRSPVVSEAFGDTATIKGTYSEAEMTSFAQTIAP